MPKSKGRKPPERRRPGRPPDLDTGPPGAPDDDVRIVVATSATGDRAAAFLPRFIARLDGEGTYLVSEMQKKSMAIEGLRNDLDLLVMEARDAGVSWAAIGWSIGVTGEAARQRWGDVDPAVRGPR